MQIEPIAHFRSPLTSKFGIPRQGGLAQSLEGLIVFEPPYRHAEAVRGLEEFSHLWIIWEFSANRHAATGLTVRPPRLGGNQRVGVFASRSPFRPNGLGLTCAYINKVEIDEHLGPVILVGGADLMDGTPIYDLKPYVRYADCHPDARSGFVDDNEWQPLPVEIPEALSAQFSERELKALREVLALDPRPRYQEDPDRTYGMPFAGRDVRFRVGADGCLRVVSVQS
ncbi:MAG: tRNA (N6-threonylcarbamoyladenosine(37)-N6)-methyltransferase TrmO [Prevotella sp.]|nr:tRNA (N6-threonylcarbamoyladenosine(37)-N6)-methyltransferase TrmO [Prevotella sp.]